MDSSHTITRFIEISPHILGGQPHIVGHPVSVQDIALWYERMGLTAEQIASKHNLSLAEVFAALAYYFHYRDKFDKSILDGA